MKILLVEDDEKLGTVLTKVLKSYNFEVDWAKDGDECFDYVDYNAESPYDVVLLDWMLPGKNGNIICKELRSLSRYNYSNGIIFLTARDAMDDIVAGLDAGADDYIVKPFENNELIARINSVNRRKCRTYIGETVKSGNIILNKNDHSITNNGKSTKLSRIEFLLLDLLISNKNKVTSRETIAESVWGINEDVSPANIDSYVYLLRKKLKSVDADVAINLYKSIGYKLEPVK